MRFPAPPQRPSPTSPARKPAFGLAKARAPRRCAALLGATLFGCAEPTAPPGADPPVASTETVVIAAPAASEQALSDDRAPRSGPEPGSAEDNLPFVPTGERVASIAWRTWVYTDTGPKRTRHGYLRAGAIVDRRGPEIRNEGCQGGWWRINPRGFVCVGKGATLDLSHPVAVLAQGRPRRGQGLPYGYVLSSGRPPHLYFKLPDAKAMTSVEGRRWIGDAAIFKAKTGSEGIFDWLGMEGASAPPDHVVQAPSLEKPYGTNQRLHFAAHAGQVSSDSGFALSGLYEWEGRVFGLTTEHDLIALDRTKVVKPSSFRGLELGPEADLPAAFVTKQWALRYQRAASGQLEPKGSFDFRRALDLTGATLRYEGVGFFETTDEEWVPLSSITLIPKRTSFPSFATGSRKWLEVSINDQVLIAYEGQKAVYVTLVSTGRGGMGDPEKVPATVRGTYMVHSKHVTATMDGEEDIADSFELRDVPFVQYFHKGYALHGTYWHDDFGKVRSHGCINLAPVDAAWLFEWTDPAVPAAWHGALNKDRGTVVHIRP